jgi:hypothetical protein
LEIEQPDAGRYAREAGTDLNEWEFRGRKGGVRHGPLVSSKFCPIVGFVSDPILITPVELEFRPGRPNRIKERT